MMTLIIAALAVAAAIFLFTVGLAVLAMVGTFVKAFFKAIIK